MQTIKSKQTKWHEFVLNIWLKVVYQFKSQIIPFGNKISEKQL